MGVDDAFYTLVREIRKDVSVARSGEFHRLGKCLPNYFLCAFTILILKPILSYACA
jgi:hypothetical protein